MSDRYLRYKWIDINFTVRLCARSRGKDYNIFTIPTAVFVVIIQYIPIQYAYHYNIITCYAAAFRARIRGVVQTKYLSLNPSTPIYDNIPWMLQRVYTDRRLAGNRRHTGYRSLAVDTLL